MPKKIWKFFFKKSRHSTDWKKIFTYDTSIKVLTIKIYKELTKFNNGNKIMSVLPIETIWMFWAFVQLQYFGYSGIVAQSHFYRHAKKQVFRNIETLIFSSTHCIEYFTLCNPFFRKYST